MRQLTLIRHAKSSWEDTGLDDFDRPLNARGRENAPLMGSRLHDEGICFDLIVSSPALRAITTAQLIADQTGYPHADILEEASIYESTVNSLLKVIQSLQDEYLCVALVGHNPGISGLACYLSDQSGLNFPTCAFAQLEFDVNHWRCVSAKSGQIKRYDYPKKSRPSSPSA